MAADENKHSPLDIASCQKHQATIRFVTPPG
jgi:hypothetical protein